MITSYEPGRAFDGADMGGVEVAPMSVPQEVPGIQNPEKKSSIGVSKLSPIFRKNTGNHSKNIANLRTCRARMPKLSTYTTHSPLAEQRGSLGSVAVSRGRLPAATVGLVAVGRSLYPHQ